MKNRKPLPPRKAYPKRSTKPIASRSTRVRTKPKPNVCRPYLDWLKLQACCVSNCFTGDWTNIGSVPAEWLQCVFVDPAHVLKKNHCMGDLWNAVPLARHLHDAQEGHTAEFEARYKISMAGLAAEYTERWLATDEGKAWVGAQGETAA